MSRSLCVEAVGRHVMMAMRCLPSSVRCEPAVLLPAIRLHCAMHKVAAGRSNADGHPRVAVAMPAQSRRTVGAGIGYQAFLAEITASDTLRGASA